MAKPKKTDGASVVRDIGFTRGAAFFDGEKGVVMFKFVSDPSSVYGPKVATESEKIEHADAYRQYLAAKGGEAKANL